MNNVKAESEANTKTYTCSECGIVRTIKVSEKKPRMVPNGWKNKPSGLVCKECQKESFSLRATDFTIAGIVDGGTWAQFLDACKLSWKQASNVLNWATNTLWTNDVIRKPGDTKMPKRPPIYLYGVANERGACRDVGAQSRQALLRLAEDRYNEARYEVIWTGDESLSNFKYPQPFPVPRQAWRAELGQDNVMLMSLPLGGTRWTVRLLGGPMMASRTAAFRQIVAGDIEAGQLDIIRTIESKTARGKTGQDSDPESGHKLTIGVKLKVSGWFPKTAIKELSGTLSVRTDTECFLIATLEGGTCEPWKLHGQQITRSIARHRRWLAAVSDDRKFERRKPTRDAKRYNNGTWARCDRHHDVLNNWIHESTRQLVNKAARLKVACVVFAKDETGMESFPWFKWETTLAGKLKAVGIDYIGSTPAARGKPKPVPASGSVPSETP